MNYTSSPLFPNKSHLLPIYKLPIPHGRDGPLRISCIYLYVCTYAVVAIHPSIHPLTLTQSSQPAKNTEFETPRRIRTFIYLLFSLIKLSFYLGGCLHKLFFARERGVRKCVSKIVGWAGCQISIN